MGFGHYLISLVNGRESAFLKAPFMRMLSSSRLLKAG